MRGEFIGVWSETWREIWLPLIDHEHVPKDIFCELYRELAVALRDPPGAEALTLPLMDAIQLRQAFDRALQLAGISVERSRADEAFENSGAVSLEDAIKRKAAAEVSLTALIGDTSDTATVFGQALADLADNPQKRAEAKERALD